jgi:hypothetical protein
MLKKSFAFGLLAAGLMLAPGAALADVQSNQQNATQNGAASGFGNTVVNTSNQTNIQDITKFKHGRCSGGYNAQFSGQNVEQNGVAVGTANTVVNQAQQGSLQNATEIASGYHNCKY